MSSLSVAFGELIFRCYITKFLAKILLGDFQKRGISTDSIGPSIRTSVHNIDTKLFCLLELSHSVWLFLES